MLLICVIVTGGCIQSPAIIDKETPGVLKNISDDISAMQTPNVTIEGMLQPLKTTADYIKPPVIASTPVTMKTSDDPIVGNWIYVGDSGYRCDAQFTSDSKASASCSAWVIPIVQKLFTWIPATSSPYDWMRNYTLTEISTSNNYAIMYSEHTGRLTSDVIPGNGYFVKVK